MLLIKAIIGRARMSRNIVSELIEGFDALAQLPNHRCTQHYWAVSGTNLCELPPKVLVQSNNSIESLRDASDGRASRDNNG